jgi:PKD repeat protein
VAFSSDQTLGLIPLEINFSDDSEGLVAWWEWDFGDGSTSTEQHPAHTYTEPGIYDVSLTIRDYAGNPLTMTQTDLVRVFSEYLPGDLNFDANTTIADVVLLVNIILGHISPDDAQIAAGDLNQDGQLSVQDLVFLVNLILYG